ncbi:MAG: rod-binding protein [Spirochaetia bacterium]|jgi:flagellar protein FlgJ|nr:rod-binding protein [Spirochaetia bacterium]
MEIGSSALSAMNQMTMTNSGRSSASSISSMERNLGDTNDDKVKQACSDFEAILIKQMLDSMRKTVEKTSLLGGGMAEDIFEDMIYDEYAKKMSKTGDFGIKDMLYRQLSTNSSDILIK